MSCWSARTKRFQRRTWVERHAGHSRSKWNGCSERDWEEDKKPLLFSKIIVPSSDAIRRLHDLYAWPNWFSRFTWCSWIRRRVGPARAAGTSRSSWPLRQSRRGTQRNYFLIIEVHSGQLDTNSACIKETHAGIGDRLTLMENIITFRWVSLDLLVLSGYPDQLAPLAFRVHVTKALRDKRVLVERLVELV